MPEYVYCLKPCDGQEIITTYEYHKHRSFTWNTVLLLASAVTCPALWDSHHTPVNAGSTPRHMSYEVMQRRYECSILYTTPVTCCGSQTEVPNDIEVRWAFVSRNGQSNQLKVRSSLGQEGSHATEAISWLRLGLRKYILLCTDQIGVVVAR